MVHQGRRQLASSFTEFWWTERRESRKKLVSVCMRSGSWKAVYFSSPLMSGAVCFWRSSCQNSLKLLPRTLLMHMHGPLYDICHHDPRPHSCLGTVSPTGAWSSEVRVLFHPACPPHNPTPVLDTHSGCLLNTQSEQFAERLNKSVINTWVWHLLESVLCTTPPPKPFDFALMYKQITQTN